MLYTLDEYVLPELFELIKDQLWIIPKNIQDENEVTRIGPIINTLHKILRNNYEPDSEFMMKASSTFHLYAQFILENFDSELDDLRTRLLIDFMRIYCAVVGDEGIKKLTESNETLFILAKGIQPIIKGLVSSGKIGKVWKMESYKILFAYSQDHQFNFIFQSKFILLTLYLFTRS
ncbi:hypothetical protein BY996DRAFT_2043095 [Phakopsora pachyrhizi]|nr:hypothetical protein BY996DRAFT_2043095 [Phakopsora pachyrhizi]